MTKISVVTGGAGFIGCNLVQRLIQRGDTVYVLDDLSTGFKWNIPVQAKFYQIDVSDRTAMESLSLSENRVDTVFHLAAQSSGEASFDNPSRDILVNYAATYHVLKWSENNRAKRFIYASSMSVYGAVGAKDLAIAESHPCDPVSYYGCNKLASEKLIRVFTRSSVIRPTIFRLFNVYGPGQNMKNMKQGMVSIYMSYLMKNIPILVKGSLERFRDFIYIEDVVDALLRAEDCESAFDETLNLGTGIKTTVSELLHALLTAYQKSGFDREAVISEGTPGDVHGLIADTTKLKACLEWEPRYRIAEGVPRMKRWVDETAGRWVG